MIELRHGLLFCEQESHNQKKANSEEPLKEINQIKDFVFGQTYVILCSGIQEEIKEEEDSNEDG